MSNQKDLFEILHADHEKVNDLLSRLRDTDEPGRARRIFDEVHDELEIHASAEEETLYTRLSVMGKTEELEQEALKEHANIRECLEQMEGLDADDERWAAGVEALVTAVDHHVTEEEGKMFRAMKTLFTPDQLNELKIDFQNAKRILKREMAA